MDGKRERRLERLMDELDANTKAEALDLAMKHTLESKRALEDAKDHLTPEQARQVGTSVVKLTGYNHVRVR